MKKTKLCNLVKNYTKRTLENTKKISVRLDNCIGDVVSCVNRITLYFERVPVYF